MNAVQPLRDAVERALDEDDLVPANRHLVVACSGGPDSRALLDALVALAPARRLTLAVAVVDHGLRPEAAAEARAVVAVAAGLGLPAAALAVQLAGRSMAAARRARYQALAAHARAVGAGAIAVGHTATDQAETLLDRLIRGAGARGLGAMAPRRPLAPGLALVRPLLAVSAAEVAAYVAARGLDVVHDPTNGDRRYRRSRLRHEVLPLLRRERADLDQALAALAARLRAEAAALDAVAADAWARLVTADGLDAAGVSALPEAVAVRILERAAAVPLGAVHVAALLRLCADRRGTRALDLPHGRRAERRYDRLAFGPQGLGAPVGPRAEATAETEVAVTGPGTYVLCDMEVEVTDALYQGLGAVPLVLRHVRPGDRTGTGKVQDLLVNAKVPRPERARLPLLVRAGEVVWVSGLRLTAPGAVQ